MNKDLFDLLCMWQADQSSSRSVSIELGKGGVRDDLAVWCFDYKIMDGAFIKTKEELEHLDLAKQKRERVIREFEQLKVADELQETDNFKEAT